MGDPQQDPIADSRASRQRRSPDHYLPQQQSDTPQGLVGGSASGKATFGSHVAPTAFAHPAFLNGLGSAGQSYGPGHHPFSQYGTSGADSAFPLHAPTAEHFGTLGYGQNAYAAAPNVFATGSRPQPSAGALQGLGQSVPFSPWQTGRPGPHIGSAAAGPQIGALGSVPAPQIGQAIGQAPLGPPHYGSNSIGSGSAASLPRNLIGTADALPSLHRRTSFGQQQQQQQGGGPAIGQLQPLRSSTSSQRLIGQRTTASTASIGTFLPGTPSADSRGLPGGPPIGTAGLLAGHALRGASGFPPTDSLQRAGLVDSNETTSTLASSMHGYPVQPQPSTDSLASLDRLSLAPEPTAYASSRSRGPAASPVAKVKVICSHGGRFVRVAGGGFEYEGGETRLVSVPNNCAFRVLVDSLERVAGNVTHTSTGSDRSDLGPSLRFQLPSEPNTYVDLVDDEDVQLMFDEWADYVAGGRHSTAKLHIFVDLQSVRQREAGGARVRASVNSSEGVTDQLTAPMRGTASPVVSSGSPGIPGHQQQQQHRQEQPGSPLQQPSIAEEEEEDTTLQQAHRQLNPQLQQQQQQQQPGRPPSGGSGISQNRIDLRDISDRLEIISPEDVTLVKFLGAGGYGEVYLGKWHSSEAAIKCLNPSLFAGGDGGHVSHAAMVELIREAEILGSLRHPNVVWVYGVVLPRMTDDLELDTDQLCEDSVDIATCTAFSAASANPRGQPGSVRPPAIVTEFLSQGSLRGVLSRKSDLLQGSLVRVLIAMDAAKGMEYLHSKKIVHFDLKSANLLLGYRDRRAICKVADFGLSKQKRETYVSGVSSQRGTLPWIAPEIIKTPHAVTEKVDVFSFGVVLWELWTGREPYEGLNYHALLHQITTSVTTVRPVLPNTPEWEATGEPSPPEPCGGYQELVERCWGDSPALRPSFREIVASLRNMAAALRPARRSSALGLPPGGPATPPAEEPRPGFKPGSEPSSPQHPQHKQHLQQQQVQPPEKSAFAGQAVQGAGGD